MSNNINWGKIYESTAWGSGVTDNNISWGKSYADLAGGGGFTGLLDTYSGAAAAYSLRQLSSTYSGNAIKVRRASDNAEQDIAFSNNELDTATLETFASGTDAFVTTWYDQSGSGNNATQTSASSQPQIVSNGTSISDLNGKPKVKPVAGNSHMTINTTGISIPNNSIIYSIGDYINTADGVILSSVKSTDYGDCISLGTNFLGSNSGVISTRLGGSTGGRNSKSESLSGYVDGDKFLTNTLVTQDFLNSNTLFNNTSADGSVSHRANIGTSGFFLFRAVNFYGKSELQEVIIYDGSVVDNSANRDSIQTNINDYYSIY